MVVFQTDKSGRFWVNSLANYRKLVRPHVECAPQISRAGHDTIENALTAHGISWVRMLSAGENSRQEIDRQGIKIRMVEKAGRSVKSPLQHSNQFKKRICSREGCPVCPTEMKGLLDKNGVNYVITSCENVYKGETSKNAYIRGKQHLDEYNNKMGKSVMWRHCRELHEIVLQIFKMRVTGQYQNDAMLRQIAEAVRINNCPIDKRINDRTE